LASRVNGRKGKRLRLDARDPGGTGSSNSVKDFDEERMVGLSYVRRVGKEGDIFTWGGGGNQKKCFADSREETLHHQRVSRKKKLRCPRRIPGGDSGMVTNGASPPNLCARCHHVTAGGGGEKGNWPSIMILSGKKG